MADEVWERFLAALEPQHDSGRLGSLLFQFPLWFGIRQSNKHDILECTRRCVPYRLCVELRNSFWMSPENADETLDFLTSYAVPYVVVDMRRATAPRSRRWWRRPRTALWSASTGTASPMLGLIGDRASRAVVCSHRGGCRNRRCEWLPRMDLPTTASASDRHGDDPTLAHWPEAGRTSSTSANRQWGRRP